MKRRNLVQSAGELSGRHSLAVDNKPQTPTIRKLFMLLFKYYIKITIQDCFNHRGRKSERCSELKDDHSHAKDYNMKCEK